MQFDVVVGNPPYNGPHKHVRLWPKFWQRAFRDSRRWILFITPSSWMGPHCSWGGKRLWRHLDDYGAWASRQFNYPGHGVTVAHVLVDLDSKAGLHLSEPYSRRLQMVPRGCPELVDSLMAERPIAAGARSMGGWRVSWVRSRMIREDTVRVWAPDEQTDNRMLTYLQCKDAADAERVRGVLLDKRDVFNRHCRWGGWMSDSIVHLFVEAE